MSRRPGFTLIELVVVIMILGILAAVAAPKFFNTSGTAIDNGLKQSLATVRSAIELYNAKTGTLPPCDATDGTTLKTALSAYLRTFPVSPVGALNSNIKAVTSTAADVSPTMGWMYNTLTGEFICNCKTASTNSGPAYDTF